MALGIASVHLTDKRKKVQSGLGLSRDSLSHSLVPDVFLTTFLLGLGTEEKP